MSAANEGLNKGVSLDGMTILYQAEVQIIPSIRRESELNHNAECIHFQFLAIKNRD